MSEPNLRQKVKAYSKSGALTAEVTQSKSSQKDKEPAGLTLNLEVAPSDGKNVNWDSKIVLQLSTSELPELCALLMGYINQLCFSRPTKSIKMELQDKHVYLKGSEKSKRAVNMPIETADIFKLNVLVLELLKKQNNCDDVAVIIASLRMFARRVA